jgi:tight adherence protein C
MSELELLPVLLAVGVSAVLAAAALRAAIASVPGEDRRWRERPPLGWRLAWPLVRLLATLFDPVLPPRWRARCARGLRQSGLDLALDAAQVAAGCAIGALCLGAAVWMAGAWTAGVVPVPGEGRWLALAVVLATVLGAWWPLSWLRERRAARLRTIGRALPFYLDVVTLSVESGANLTGALQHAVAKGPGGPLQVELERVLRDIRAGRTRADALRALAERLDLPAVSSWVAALVSAERHGSGLGPILRAQAEQRRQERFQQAEKLAMKAPVKMLFPLLVFIFPCTFVLLFFPIVVRLLEEGVLR